MVKLWFSSSLAETIRDKERVSFVFAQLATTFGFGALQWAAIRTVGNQVQPIVHFGQVSGLATLVLSFAFLFFAPVGASIGLSATTRNKLRATISPSDINLLTMAVGFLFLYFEHSDNVVLALGNWLPAVAYFYVVTFWQDQIVRKVVGVSLSGKQLAKRLFRANVGIAKMERMLEDANARDLLGISDGEDVNGFQVHEGNDGRFKFNVSVFPDKESDDPQGMKSCLVAIVGYTMGQWGRLSESHSRKWLDIKTVSLKAALSPDEDSTDKSIELTPEPQLSFIPKALVDHTVEPTKNLFHRLQKAGALTSAALMLLATALIYVAYNVGVIPTVDEALAAFLILLVSQISQVSLSRKKPD